ncbi:MAG: hypothetical protein J6Y89_05485 [Lachnospiraceae bacterium]|nr:hypothetical protein [Lachnospiraceae bacterium]
MDNAKLRKILSVIAVVVLILIVLYNSGLFGGGDAAPDIPDQTQSSNGDAQTQADAQNDNQSSNGEQPSQVAQSDVNVQNAGTGQNTETDQTTETGQNTGNDQDTAAGQNTETSPEYVDYHFRNDKLLTQHYEKHGIEMGFDSKESYEKAASDVINNPAALHKLEAEDGDHVYYVEDTNEFAILSTDGYLRTYFLPSAGKAYFDRQ